MAMLYPGGWVYQWMDLLADYSIPSNLTSLATAIVNNYPASELGFSSVEA